MIIQAELKCKQTGCEANPCAVDKVIELPSPRFQQFSRALLADYDFIAENKNAIRHDDDSRNCLLILDAEGKDGFLVDPQGYNYARYSAFVPNARSLLTPDMGIDRSYLSPAEPWRNENRDEMLRMTLRVNGKPDYTLVLPADEEYLDAVKNYLDIDVFADAMLCDIRFKLPYIGELIRDPDFYTKFPSAVMDDFAAGRLGALEYKSSPSSLMELKNRWDALNDKSFEDCVDVLPVFPAPDGIRYSNSSSIFWSESYISSDVDDTKAERILALFEFLLSDEGQDFCHYGLEGIDYEKDKDGNYSCLLDTKGESLTTALARKYPSSILFSGIATWGGSWKDFEVNDMNTLRYGKFATILASESANYCKEHTTQVSRPYAFMSYPKEPTEEFSTSNAFKQFISCIIGNDDAVDMWENVLKQMRSDGLDEYIQRQNENFAKSQN